MNSFYTVDELNQIGLKVVGKGVRISRYARFYDPHKIVVGDNSRIDDFAIASGHVTIGCYVHIGAGAMLFGGDLGITVEDFAGVSGGAKVYAVTEDLHSGMLTNPTTPGVLRKTIQRPVLIRKHAIVGASSTLLPGSELSLGSILGANSLLVGRTREWTIYSGVPAKTFSQRPVIDEKYEAEALRIRDSERNRT